MVFKGNTSTDAISEEVNLPLRLSAFSLVNRSGGAITANIGVVQGSTLILFAPLDSALGAGEAYIYSGKPITIEPDWRIYVSVSGSCDYYCTLESLKVIDNVRNVNQ
jgi:hypothetical protein